jgi:hypothetical protein
MTTDPFSIRAAVVGRQGVVLVRCYHCGREGEVPSRAMTVGCPHCYKQLNLEDISVRAMHWGGSLRTTGVVIIHKRARAVCNDVVSSCGVRILGSLEAAVRSAGPVYVGPNAIIKGSINAPTWIVEPGAQLIGGPFRVPGCFIEAAPGAINPVRFRSEPSQAALSSP